VHLKRISLKILRQLVYSNIHELQIQKPGGKNPENWMGGDKKKIQYRTPLSIISCEQHYWMSYFQLFVLICNCNKPTYEVYREAEFDKMWLLMSRKYHNNNSSSWQRVSCASGCEWKRDNINTVHKAV